MERLWTGQLQIAPGAASLGMDIRPSPGSERSARNPRADLLRRRLQVELRTQVGTDLGTRMHAASEARPGAAAIIGTDCPFLEPGDLVRTAEILGSSDANLVIVPALDGGYVLIAVDRPRPQLFEQVDWGSGRVLAQTRERARSARLRLLELEPRRDVDRPEDLESLDGVLSW